MVLDEKIKLNLSYRNNLYTTMSSSRMALSEEILQKIIPVLNEVHGQNFSYRFWKIIIGDYINSVISIKTILENKEMKSPPEWDSINSHAIPTFKQKFRNRLIQLAKHLRSTNHLRTVRGLLMTQNDFSIGFPKIPNISKEVGTVLPTYYPIYLRAGTTRKREKVVEISNHFKDRFYRNIIQQIPKVYIEYFDVLHNSVPLITPERKTFHVHNLYSLYTKMIVARYVENGSKLFWYQHGAYYGEIKGHNAHFNEGSVADEFRSWGWKIRENDEPWKAYRLHKFKLEYEGARKTGKFDFLMCFPDVYDANLPFYKTATSYFLRNIDSGKYTRFLARPRALNKLQSHANRIAFIKDPRVTRESGLSSMASSMSQCKIIIQFTVPSTNFLECLYVDHVTIGILNNDEPTEIIKPFYDFFIKNGVLHEDFQSLVRHLNNVNVPEWWDGIVKHPIYREFKHTFLKEV